MLIISKFRDYYDSALAGGVDKTIVYRRNTEEIERPEWMNRVHWFPELTSKRAWHSGKYMHYETKFYTLPRSGRVYEFNLKVFIIGFCGKVYKGVRLQHGQTYPGIHYQPTYHYEGESLTKEMLRLGIRFKDKDVNCFNFDPIQCTQMIDDKIVSFFNIDERNHLHRQERLHKWSERTETAQTNPVLKDFQFYRAVDSYTALQEIMMYISGVIGTGEKDTIKISDKDMRDAKGFDEWSFKNPTRVKDLR